MSNDLTCLLPTLVDLLSKVGSSPLRLDVSLSDPEEISKLKEDLRSAQATCEFLRGQVSRVEHLYAQESALNNRLLDFIRENGLTVPSYIFKAVS